MTQNQKDHILRQYKQGDEDKIVELLTMAFDDWRFREEKALEFWRWMYRDNPGKKNIVQVGVSGEDIIAVEHGFSLKAKVGKHIVNCHYGADLVVHPDFRRRGISNTSRDIKKKIMLKQDSKFNYSCVDNPIIIRVHTQRHGIFPFQLSRYLRIKDVGLHSSKKATQKSWLTNLSFQGLKILNVIKNALRGSRSVNNGFIIRDVNQFGSGTDEFWHKVSSYYEFIAVRDREYLNWRYCDPRAGKYVIRQAEDDGSILGYLVLTVVEKTHGYPEGYILDLLTLPDRIDVADALVAEAADYFDSLDINAIICFVVKNHPYEKSLKNNGFIDSRKPANLFYYDIGEYRLNENVEKIAPIKVHWSYSDLYFI